MKTDRNQNFNKGFSPLIIIVIIAVIVVGIIAFNKSNNSKVSSPSSNNQLSNQQTQISSQSILGLEKIENDAYVFYYPKGYVKSDKDMGSAKVLYYVADLKKDTGEGISLNMYPSTTRMETPTSDFCKTFLQFSLRGVKNVRIIDAKPVDFVKSHGCDFLYVDDSIPGKLVAHQKHLWYKEGANLNGYSSKAIYLLTSLQAEKDAFDQAVNNFKLK